MVKESRMENLLRVEMLFEEKIIRYQDEYSDYSLQEYPINLMYLRISCQLKFCIDYRVKMTPELTKLWAANFVDNKYFPPIFLPGFWTQS